MLWVIGILVGACLVLMAVVAVYAVREFRRAMRREP